VSAAWSPLAFAAHGPAVRLLRSSGPPTDTVPAGAVLVDRDPLFCTIDQACHETMYGRLNIALTLVQIVGDVHLTNIVPH
jgi:hypothetical protein